MLTRAIPSTGEAIPVIGLGTWAAFDVGETPSELRPLEEVLKRFSEGGGRLVDSSPMYGRSEAVAGAIAARLGLTDSLFFATKVWTKGRRMGERQVERSLRLFHRRCLDLEQVHNLVDAPAHLATLAALKEEGRLRYVGITHYTSSAYPEVERLLRTEALDFLQINYSLAEPDSDRRLIPLAAERGVAVIANRPFGGGDALRKAMRQPFPPWGAEIGCRSWPQIFLKWVLGNPAVTCVIPATRDLRHLADNVLAAEPPLPDEATRHRMLGAVRELL